MTFTLPSPRRRFLVCLCSGLLAALLGYFAARSAMAAHFQEADTRAGYERAVQLEPSDSRNWYLLGRSYLYDLEQPDPARAIQAFRKSVSLDPYSAEALLDLANAYDGEGDIAHAREAYISAQRVYPQSADVCWSYGNFLLRQGEQEAAFAQIHKSVELQPKRATEAFALALRAQPDPAKVLDKVVPATPTVYLPIIQTLSGAGDLATAQLVWNRFIALHQKVPIAEMVAFVDALTRQGRVTDARDAWTQAVSSMENAPPADPAGSLIWDGGFESKYKGGGFAWQFSTMTRNVQFSIDGAEKHSGNSSLLILFNGRENLNLEDACHYIVPEPGKHYLLTGWLKTQSLTSSEGVRLQIFVYTPNQNESVITDEVHGTQEWKQVQLPWVAPPGAAFGRVCVRRKMSGMPESNIQGAAWIDDVSLTPAEETAGKP
jgi:tetratricopeptide (TPR) repeat protein